MIVSGGEKFLKYKNPVPTVDIIIYHPDRGIVLVERKNHPLGWALPGGFVDYGEMVEHAAIREAYEETSLHVRLHRLSGVYSSPDRDERLHTISITYIAFAENPNDISGKDDAKTASFFHLNNLPLKITFDHRIIINDFIANLYY